MRCSCLVHRADYDRRYVARVERGWPRWLAYVFSPPASPGYDAAKATIARYEQALKEGRIGVGFLGAVETPDAETAREITATFGLRRPEASDV